MIRAKVPMEHIDSDKSKSGKSAKRVASSICAISGKDTPRRELVALETLHHSLEERICDDHPELRPDALVSRAEIARYRTLYVEELLKAKKGELSESTARWRAASPPKKLSPRTRRKSSRITGPSASACRIISRASGAAGPSSSCSAACLRSGLRSMSWCPTPQRFDVYPYILLNLILSCSPRCRRPSS